MLSIEFEVYCGICGSDCCGETKIDCGNRITVTCSDCEDTLRSLRKQIDILEEVILELRNRVNE